MFHGGLSFTVIAIVVVARIALQRGLKARTPNRPNRPNRPSRIGCSRPRRPGHAHGARLAW